jgi:hypothetical protein
MAVVDKRRAPAGELIEWLRERGSFEEKCPSPHPIPDLLALAYASRDGMDDAFAIAHALPGTPHREPEVEALKWNVCPIDEPGHVDEVGRRIFELEFAVPQSAHPGWDRSPLAPQA